MRRVVPGFLWTAFGVSPGRWGIDRLIKLEDLAPVAIGFKSTTVPATAEYDTAAKLVDYAKKNPGKLSYSTTGSGGATHLVGEYDPLRDECVQFAWMSAALKVRLYK